MLSGSHTAKWLQDSIRKYFRGFGLKELLCQTRVFGVKIADPVLDGTWRSLRGILTLRCLINRGSKIFLKLYKRRGGGGISKNPLMLVTNGNGTDKCLILMLNLKVSKPTRSEPIKNKVIIKRVSNISVN